jgi:DNA-damage-inducible protein D
VSDERDRTQEPAAISLFDDETAEQTIRRMWHEGRWFFSVVDVIGALTGSERPRKYWSDLKRRLGEEEGFREVSAKIGQLKMRAPDGKERVTDAADAETLLRIIQSIPSPKAEPIKQWLARVGTERLAEIDDPALAVERARMEYLQKGYSDDWIEKRLQGIAIREQLTDEWRERGAHDDRHFSKLTNVLHEGTFEVKVQEHKRIKSLGPRHNLRDSMTTLELLLTGLAEETAKTLHQVRDSQGVRALERDTHEAGEVGGAARRDIEQRSGQPVVSPENYRTLTTQSDHSLWSQGGDAASTLPAPERAADEQDSE